jgi:putative ABC transport system permease protein
MLSSFQLVPSLASEAFRALSSNKLRSALAALGITIGIAAVVCVVAIGRASSVRLEEQLQNLGDNLIWVEAGSRNVSGVRTGTHGMNNLTLEDAKAIIDEVRLIKSVSPHVDSHVSVVHENRNWTTTYRGVGPEYIDIKRWGIAHGNWFTQAEVDRVANVCVIGQTVREQLFGSADPVGGIIRISNQLFEVIGLLAPKGQTGYGFDQDDVLLLPYSTAQKKLRGKGYDWVDDIMLSAV